MASLIEKREQARQLKAEAKRLAKAARRLRKRGDGGPEHPPNAIAPVLHAPERQQSASPTGAVG